MRPPLSSARRRQRPGPAGSIAGGAAPLRWPRGDSAATVPSPSCRACRQTRTNGDRPRLGGGAAPGSDRAGSVTLRWRAAARSFRSMEVGPSPAVPGPPAGPVYSRTLPSSDPSCKSLPTFTWATVQGSRTRGPSAPGPYFTHGVSPSTTLALACGRVPRPRPADEPNAARTGTAFVPPRIQGTSGGPGHRRPVRTHDRAPSRVHPPGPGCHGGRRTADPNPSLEVFRGQPLPHAGLGP